MNDIQNMKNSDLEVEVISSFVSDGNIFHALSPTLSRELFTEPDTKTAFDVMKDIEKNGEVVEFMKVSLKLREKGVNVAKFIGDHNASYEVTRQQVEMLQELMVKRNLYILCVEGERIATTPALEVEEFRNLLQSFNTITNEGEADFLSFDETVDEFVNDIAQRKDGNVEEGMRTGLDIFDKRNGFHLGDLVIIAGETSNGKSSLATTIARNMAGNNIPVAYYSLEMSAKQLTARILAKDVNVPSSRLLYSRLTDDEFATVFDVSLDKRNMPIFFDEKSKMSFRKLCNSVRVLARRKGVKVAFIDYLQILVNGKENESREQMLGDMARELKRLAVEANVCVVALSQLSRDPNSRGGEPSLSRMRGSGQIEEACDMALLIWRPELYGKELYADNTSTAGTAMLKLAKGRNVGIGTDIVLFDGDLTYFRNDDGRRAVQKQRQNNNLPF